MSTSKKIQDALKARQQEAVQLEEAANEAERLEGEIANLRRELLPLEERKARLVALGDNHLEQAIRTHYPGVGQVDWQPLRSQLTGAELAANVQRNIATIQAEIAGRERRIQALLGE